MNKSKLFSTTAPARIVIEYTRPWLYKKQEQAIFDCVDSDGNPARYALIEASTKSGKTAGCLAWLLEQALLYGGLGKIFWWVAPVYMQTAIAFRRLKAMIPIELRSVSQSDKSITLINGSLIQFRSGEKPDNLFGDDVYAAVIDEASRLKKESWYAVRSTVTKTRGKMRIIGNVKGRRNWFFEQARLAEMGGKRMAYARITAMDAVEAGVLEREEIEDAKERLPELIFKELYEAEAGDDGGNPFGLANIKACTIEEFSEEVPVACGVDLAKHKNHSVIIGLDRNAVVCGLDRFQDSWGQTKRRVLYTVGHVPTLVDSTGVGDAIFEELAGVRSNFDPFVFSAKTKQQLLEKLMGAIHQRKIRIPPGPIVQELEAFEYEVTRTHVRYSAPEGYNDDCVMALALAYEMYTRVRPYFDHAGPVTNERESPWRLNAD